MIKAIHTLVYSSDPPATRRFMSDILGWPFVRDPDSAPDWLIFRTGPSEMGVHPAGDDDIRDDGAFQPHHSVSLMCDHLEGTVAELRERGAEFLGAIEDESFGLTIQMVVPGAGTMLLYEPRHPEAYDLRPGQEDGSSP